MGGLINSDQPIRGFAFLLFCGHADPVIAAQPPHHHHHSFVLQVLLVNGLLMTLSREISFWMGYTEGKCVCEGGGEVMQQTANLCMFGFLSL